MRGWSPNRVLSFNPTKVWAPFIPLATAVWHPTTLTPCQARGSGHPHKSGYLRGYTHYPMNNCHNGQLPVNPLLSFPFYYINPHSPSLLNNQRIIVLVCFYWKRIPKWRQWRWECCWWVWWWWWWPHPWSQMWLLQMLRRPAPPLTPPHLSRLPWLLLWLLSLDFFSSWVFCSPSLFLLFLSPIVAYLGFMGFTYIYSFLCDYCCSFPYVNCWVLFACNLWSFLWWWFVVKSTN